LRLFRNKKPFVFNLTGQVIAAYIQCTPHSSGEFILSVSKEAPPQAGFRKAQLASACLPQAGAFLITLGEMTF